MATVALVASSLLIRICLLPKSAVFEFVFKNMFLTRLCSTQSLANLMCIACIFYTLYPLHMHALIYKCVCMCDLCIAVQVII